jgi:hypothetical protein
LSAAGLSYAGSAIPAENHPLIAVPKAIHALMARDLSTEFTQLISDFAV